MPDIEQYISSFSGQEIDNAVEKHSELVTGYYSETDGIFYEDLEKTIQIVGNEKFVYIDISDISKPTSYLYIDGTFVRMCADMPEAQKNEYVSLERLGNYLYKITFDTVPEYKDSISPSVGGGCSSFVRDGKLYRNLDWNYDNTAEFLVVCKDFTGMSFIIGVDDDEELDKTKLGQMPYHINDGVNNDGIMVSSHVLFNDWSYAGSGEKTHSITLLPYYILTNLHDISTIETTLSDYLNNLSIPSTLIAMHYLMQFVVTDGTTTYIVTPKSDGTGYEIVNATSNPKLTNFKWVSGATVSRSDLQEHPTGVERWNEITEDTTLEDLRFTIAYEENSRLSEFIGLRGTTKDSTDEELQSIFETAAGLYAIRSRNGELWQTCHSVVYSAKGIESLHVQEDFSKDYCSASSSEDVVGSIADILVDGVSVVGDNKIAEISLTSK